MASHLHPGRLCYRSDNDKRGFLTLTLMLLLADLTVSILAFLFACVPRWATTRTSRSAGGTSLLFTYLSYTCHKAALCPVSTSASYWRRYGSAVSGNQVV